jgi:hypothetical protein
LIIAKTNNNGVSNNDVPESPSMKTVFDHVQRTSSSSINPLLHIAELEKENSYGDQAKVSLPFLPKTPIATSVEKERQRSKSNPALEHEETYARPVSGRRSSISGRRNLPITSPVKTVFEEEGDAF